jgi:hypothetical protein
VCADEEPIMRELVPGHFAACHFPLIESKGNGAGSHVISSQSEMGDWSGPVGVSMASSASSTATLTDTDTATTEKDVDEVNPFAPPSNGHGDAGSEAAVEATAQDEAAPDAAGGSEA